MHLCCFLVFLDGEKQSQSFDVAQDKFTRAAFCVMRTAKTSLKKQSQFAGGQIGVRSCVKGPYDNKWSLGAAKKQSQTNPILGSGAWDGGFVGRFFGLAGLFGGYPGIEFGFYNLAGPSSLYQSLRRDFDRTFHEFRNVIDNHA